MNAEGGAHEIELPRNVIVGFGISSRFGKHFRRVFPRAELAAVIMGNTIRRKVYPLVKEALEDVGVTPVEVVATDASVSTADIIVEDLRSDRIDVLIGLGGGRSIDISKYAAYKLGKSWVSYPTVASHDGITSPFASLKGFDRPVSRKAKMPNLIFIDVNIIMKAPRRYNIAGFGDLVGKFISVRDWRLAHKLKGEYYGEYSASLALLSAKHVLAFYREIALGTVEGYRVLLEALVSSGVAMGIAGSTRPASGSEHLFAHALSLVAKNPPLHGEAVAVGTILMGYLHGIKWRVLRRRLRFVGAPTTAKELGVTPEEVIEALVRAATIRPERYTILGEKGLTRSAAEKLARATGVID
ncbi:MAG: NAD(P)-dependent glycerol-1-phosphate dehydrogenase [Desulfurococcales archaeon]|nr:NAD(P)-dependent glycerol-1-phosphate dehydrogenase [Desulfurococcales archaeon]